MSMLDNIKNRTLIDVDFLIKRLAKELKLFDKDKNVSEDAKDQIICSLYDTLIIILDTTHQDKIPDGLYTTWLNMTKDYWYLNKYDTLFQNNESSETESGNSNSNKKTIKSIQVGDTTTTFTDKSSQIDINGTTYNTGTINFDENILKEKYKSALHRHRRFRRPL